MEGYIVCPQCGSNVKEEQIEQPNNSFFVEYSCGNKISVTIDKVGDVITDYKLCNNKIDWENILIPFAGEFDESAKLIDERFFGWTELQFYRNMHRKKWTNKHQGKQCTNKEFLDKYFADKESYLRAVKNLEKMNLNSISASEVITKVYEDWIGEVVVEKIEEKTFESHGEEMQRIIYRVITADSAEYEGGYIVENNPIDGADNSRDFYSRDILDIIIKKEKI